jgi:hypothetical protein
MPRGVASRFFWECADASALWTPVVVTRRRSKAATRRRTPKAWKWAIVRAVDQCTVKRHILDPPAFEVTVVSAPVLAEMRPYMVDVKDLDDTREAIYTRGEVE